LGAAEFRLAGRAQFPLNDVACHISAAGLSFPRDALLLSTTEPGCYCSLRNRELAAFDRPHQWRHAIGYDRSGTLGPSLVYIGKPGGFTAGNAATCGIFFGPAAAKVRDLCRHDAALIVIEVTPFQVPGNKERQRVALCFGLEGDSPRRDARSQAGSIPVPAIEYHTVKHNDILLLPSTFDVRNKVIKLRSLDQREDVREWMEGDRRHD
jgi:hypothetical protein